MMINVVIEAEKQHYIRLEANQKIVETTLNIIKREK
jgi:hypothetical protein